MLNVDDRFLTEATIDQFWFMCHVAKFMNDNSTCFPSNHTLCECTGWKISKLNAVKKSCVDAGFLKVETRYSNNRQSSNEYTVLTDRLSVMVNLKGKKSKQIPTTDAVGCHGHGTPPATDTAPPPATDTAPEVLTNKEVLTIERVGAHAKKSSPLKTEKTPVGNEGSPPPPSLRDFPKSQTPAALAEELRALYKAYPNEWEYITTSTPAKGFDAKKRTATVEAFCEWAIGEGWQRRDFGAINARLIKWFKAEPLMQPRAAATSTPTYKPRKPLITA